MEREALCDKWLEVALAEYSALRNEINSSIQHQLIIVNFAVAGIGAIIAFVSNEVRDFSLLLVCPLVGYSALLLWANEFARLVRANNFALELSEEINSHFPSPPLGWENFLHFGPKKRTQIRFLESIWMILSLTPFSCSMFGAFIFYQRDKETGALLGLLSILIFLVFSCVALKTAKKFLGEWKNT